MEGSACLALSRSDIADAILGTPERPSTDRPHLLPRDRVAAHPAQVPPDDSIRTKPKRLLTPAAPSRQLQLDALAAAQAGVVGRSQVTELGFARGYVRDRLRGRRWRRPYPRTYVTFTGPLPFETQVWAAIVYAGGGAVASHGTAAYLCGLSESPPEEIEVTVEHGHAPANVRECGSASPGCTPRSVTRPFCRPRPASRTRCST